MTTRAARVRIAVVGASGRMGRAIVRLARAIPEVELACAIGATDVGADAGELAGIGKIGVIVREDLAAAAAEGVDVAIDFSSPAGTVALAQLAARARFALVSGTTGLAEEGRRAIEEASAAVPVLWEANMSLGVHVLGDLVRRAALALGPEYDIEIVEAHHKRKVDAPSGTALYLADMAQQGRADTLALIHGRSGKPGARPTSEIGMHAVRGGDVVGDHTAFYFGEGERLELSHRASNRDVFAHGALRAARWIAGKPAGRYRMTALLGG